MCSFEIMSLDALPSWLFAKCSYELAGIIAHIFNSSFCAGVVPEQWKRSVVTPVAKVPKPSCLTHFSHPHPFPACRETSS